MGGARWRVLVLAGIFGVGLVGWQTPASGGMARLRVAAVLPAEANDLTWTQALHVGLLRHQREGRITYTYTESVEPAEAERVLRRYAERRPDLIIAHSGTFRDAVFRVAAEFRDLNFAWPSFGSRDRDTNLAAYDTPVWEASYLAGVVAAHVTKSGKLGFVGGIPFPGCRAIFNAFRDGAREVKPGLEISPVYVGNFVDIAKAKALALSLIDRGADVFSICGSGPARGTIEAARERGVWAVGYVYDMSPLAPKNVLGSLFWDSYKGIGELLDDLQKGTFRPAKYYAGKAKQGITTFKVNDEVLATLPPSAVRTLKAYITRIERGTFDIPISFD
ncbi:MAG: BMP family protein [Armatimonadota bacterium]|nr:BMP family protein [Armatimonadota bacterium]MDR7548631.1 BMP family protein [Armatimonadota bacterium]